MNTAVFRKAGHKKLFLVLSALLLLADALFVAINYANDRRTLDNTLAQEGKQIQQAFQVALSMTLNNMSQLATFVASSPDVRSTFAAAADAVRQEGGGSGGLGAAQLRQQLYDTVAPSWLKMTLQYQVRQLHFHLGPGSTSFLRVHKPDKFGDNMDDLRHMVVDVNRDHQPRQGFELGRVYAGLRGIVPVYSDSRQQQQVGALEVGTSFSLLIGSLSEAIGHNVAVLIREDRVEDATWSRPEEPLQTGCGCFIEATSSPQLNEVLSARKNAGWQTPPLSGRTGLLTTAAGPMAVTEFDLSDYIGQRDGHETPVGRIMIWRSAEQALQDLHKNTWINILYALVGFILLELALFLGIRLTLRHLEFTVKQRTVEIQALNSQLEEIAHRDFLTGVCSRGHFMERMLQELHRSRREQHPLTLLMLDIDHFKQINDQWGHQAGDKALSSLGALLLDNCRDYDVVGRYGGEEFCLLLPGVHAQTGYRIAETLRCLIEQHILLPDDHTRVTVSIGVAECAAGDDQAGWFRRVDQALYQAKRTGRNRTVLAGTQTETASA